MKEKLNCILLVDDDEPTNFLHKILLEEIDITQHIEVAETAREALRLLEYKQPDIIFLDLNMPGMTGWDFIDKFKELKLKQTKYPLIFILTTSANPDDRKRADLIEEVAGFNCKPLTNEMVQDIVLKYFFQ